MYGARIKKARELKRLSQRELAELVKCSAGAVAHWEQESRQPDYDTLIKLSSILDVSIDYLLGNDITNNHISVALSGQKAELTPEQQKSVVDYINFLKSQNKN